MINDHFYDGKYAKQFNVVINELGPLFMNKMNSSFVKDGGNKCIVHKISDQELDDILIKELKKKIEI